MSNSGDQKTNQKEDLYRAAGVDIHEGDALVSWLQTQGTPTKASSLGTVVSGIGGFASLFKVDFSSLKSPHLVSCTDGVGTKVLLGIQEGQLRGLGQDLVAMCVNDLYTLGATPLFFLDYYATGKLEKTQFQAVLAGIQESCDACGAALIGGETAEMPGLYEKNHFDLAGFVVGVVDGESMLKPQMVQEGDLLFALPSSGFHSNGYSLIRKMIKDNAALMDSYRDRLLLPTEIYHYLPQLITAMQGAVHAVAHITGGGISGNLPRVFPEHLCAEVDAAALPSHSGDLAWMSQFISDAGLRWKEVEHVFNQGAGMVVIVAAGAKDMWLSTLAQKGLKSFEIGKMVARRRDGKALVYR
jgi:phosphoribosylformylglycinamidine cyclo-ligase